MLTKTGPGRFKHNDGDTYTIEIEPEGTGSLIVAVLGDKAITLPGKIKKSDYSAFKPNYEINVLYTFTKNAEPTAKYNVTFRDSAGTIVDTRAVRLPSGSKLPRVVPRLYEFTVGS